MKEALTSHRNSHRMIGETAAAKQSVLKTIGRIGRHSKFPKPTNNRISQKRKARNCSESHEIPTDASPCPFLPCHIHPKTSRLPTPDSRPKRKSPPLSPLSSFLGGREGPIRHFFLGLASSYCQFSPRPLFLPLLPHHLDSGGSIAFAEKRGSRETIDLDDVEYQNKMLTRWYHISCMEAFLCFYLRPFTNHWGRQ